MKTFDKDNFAVDQKLSNVFTTPSLANGKITINSISSNSRILYHQTQLTINIKLQTQLEKGKQAKLTIQFPKSLYYPNKQTGSSPQGCYIKSTKLASCTTTLENEDGNNDLPKYVKIVSFEFTDSELDVLNPFA